jgi:hypothetical protein
MTNYNFTRLSDAQALSFKLCGQLVHIARFPALVFGFSESPGCYFIESVVYFHDGVLQIGVEYQSGSVEYYPFEDLEITHIVTDTEFVK